MDWRISKTFTKNIDGYDRIQLTGYLDGYGGQNSYDLETIFVSSIEKVYTIKQIIENKIEYYSKTDDQISLQRIEKNQSLLAKYNEIIDAIEKGEING